MTDEWNDPGPWYSTFLDQGWISIYLALVAVLIAGLYELDIVPYSVWMVGFGAMICAGVLAFDFWWKNVGRDAL